MSGAIDVLDPDNPKRILVLASNAAVSEQTGLRRTAASVPVAPPDRACQGAVRSTGRSVTEVGLEVGFRSLGSFSTAFRALVGESPSDDAHRWRATGAPRIPACFRLMWTRPHGALFEKQGAEEQA